MKSRKSDISGMHTKDGIERDRVDVLTFGVGHGDCFLIEVVQSGRTQFRLLYDGGVSLPDALLTHLRDKRKEDYSKDLDVVVLSHVDTDHQGGLHQLFAESDISIGEYWSPCLPAFERLSWLFAPRVSKAVEKAGELEIAAKHREIPVLYPMEDHVERFTPEKAVTISVISPARRLLKRLYHASSESIGELLRRIPLPLEWLIRDDGPSEPERDNFIHSPFDGGTAINREMLPPASALIGLSAVELCKSAASAAKLEGLEFEPNFFGNIVLNDTSLVVVVDVVLDGMHRRRIVLSGDQENWSYISSQHPMGLAPDVLKVPHHGGRVYLWDINRPLAEALPSDGIGQFFIWMRPRAAIVSAKGLHGLPRAEFREAVRMVGTTLVCPNKRKRELLFVDSVTRQAKSCFEQFGCQGEQSEVLKLRLSAHQEDLDAAACLQGSCHRGPAPVVVMQQRLVEPDETFVRWTTGEIRRQAQWLQDFLRRERKQMLERTNGSLVDRLSLDMTSWSRIAAEAKSERRVQFCANPGPVVRYAVSNGMVWAETNEARYLERSNLVAALPEEEYDQLLSWLKQLHGILLVINRLDYKRISVGDWFKLVSTSENQPLFQLCAAQSGLPFEVFERELMPRLIRDIVSNFSGRIASLDDPHSRQPWDAGKTILHLYRLDKGIPDLYENVWSNLPSGLGSGFSDADLGFVFSKGSVLPPLYKSRTLQYGALSNFINKYYRGDEKVIRDGHVPAGMLPRVFSKAKWLDLWEH